MKNTTSKSNPVSAAAYRASVARSLMKCFAPLTPEELQAMREKEKPQEPAPLPRPRPRPRSYGNKGTPALTPAAKRAQAHQAAAQALAIAQAALLTVRESLVRLDAERLDNGLTTSLQTVGLIRRELSDAYEETARAAATPSPGNPYKDSTKTRNEAAPRNDV